MAFSPRTGLAAIAVTALAALAGAPAAGATSEIGMNINTVMLSPHLESRENALLNRLQSTGIRQVRMDAFWHWNEPTPPRTVTTVTDPGFPPLKPATTKTTTVHDFSWGITDHLSDQFAAHGLQWEPVLGYTPTWAQTIVGDAHSRPRVIADFARWAGQFAARYGSRGTRRGAYPIHRYEIWNEPNIKSFFTPKPDPDYYGRLYLAAAQAIRAADPSAVIVTGGVAMYGFRTFLRKTVAANPNMRSAMVSEVALHPYGRSAVSIVDHARSLRKAMPGIGLPGRPIALNEIGWRALDKRVDKNALPDGTRAGNFALLTDALSQSDCNISTIDAFGWATDEQSKKDPHDWWGIVHPNGTFRPPATAYVAARRRAAKTRPVPLPVCSGRATSRPLVLKLKVVGRSARCRAYAVSYAGYPVNGVTVSGTAPGRRKVKAVSNTPGRVKLCGRKRGAFRVRATAENWARSSWLRR